MNKLITGLMASTFLSGMAFAATPGADEKLAENQTFIYRILDDFPTLDPAMVEDVDTNDVMRDLFEGLVNQAPNGDVLPAGALEWTSNADKTVWTFKLRPESKWSNGDPVTAKDYVLGWQRTADPALASPYAWYIELMSVANAGEVIAGTKPLTDLGIKAVDDLTLEVTLSQPIPYFPQMLAISNTFPVHGPTIEKFGKDWTKPENMVSNGAYVLKEYAPGEKLVRVKNDQYWDAANTILTEVTTLIINDENQAYTRYLAGELDQTDVPAGQYPAIEAEFPDTTHSVPNLCTYYYMYNLSPTGPEAFKDVKVREALNLALDRQIIVDNVTAAGQIPAYWFTPPATAGFTEPDVAAAKMTQAERDEKAKALMAEAGYGPENPLTFELIYNTSEAHSQIAIAASQMWKQKLGVEVTLANQEWATFVETRANQQYQMARGAWCGDYNEPSTFLSILETNNGSNDGKYSNATVDQLLNEARTADNRGDLYKQIEEIVATEVGILPVYFYTDTLVMNASVKGWPFENVQKYWYSKDLYKVAE